MGETILIVDDEPDILDNLREAFEYNGYTVIAAPDGEAAMDRLREASDPPGIAILDLLMPALDGRALYSAMKNEPRLAKVPVVFCTSAPSEAPPGTVVMKKPIDLTRLLALVRAQCPP
jgi:DNA-binding response OmpR family regulator